jgi:ribosomal-protein-alanine N-acetyltransferase
MAYPVRLEGDRVVLRELVGEDLDATLEIMGDPSVTALVGFPPRTRAEQAELLAVDIARARCEPRPDYFLAVTLRQTGALIGLSRLELAPGGYGELGCVLRRDRWREGHGTEAAVLLLDLAFGDLGLRRVQAACAMGHAAARAVLERLGLTYEGRMRDHLRVADGWQDSALYSMLSPEWTAART